MPFDPRLIEAVAPAVAQAAAESGVAERPIADMEAYRRQLGEFVYRSSSVMTPVFDKAKQISERELSRVIYAEGEDERVLRAAQVICDERLAKPLLVGRPDVIAEKIQECGLRIVPGKDVEILDPQDQSLTSPLGERFYQQRKRFGVSKPQAQADVRARATLLGCLVLQSGEANAMLCGMVGRYGDHLRYVRETIGHARGGHLLANMQMLMLPDRQLFICDTHVNLDPNAEEITEISLLAAAEVRRLGLTPRVALLSHSSFGSVNDASAIKMSKARDLIKAADPSLEVEGEMHGDAALSREILEREFPDTELSAEANVLVMPNVDAANISFNLLRVAAGNGIAVGGILLGTASPVHIMVPSSTVRRIVNMTAMAVVDGAARTSAR